jgi:hypothetical protein
MMMMVPYSLSLFTLTLTFTHASRAYPHGCLYHHPSYYTYDEREDISWANDDQLFNEEDRHHHVDFRTLPPKSSELRRSYERYRLTRRLGAGKFSEVYEAVDLEYGRGNSDKRQRVVSARYDGEITDCSTETEDETIGDVDSLVVLKVRDYVG